MHICAEISYGQVHSDICENVTDGKFSEEHKTFLREAFNEFLSNFEKSAGGYFVVNAEGWSSYPSEGDC